MRVEMPYRPNIMIRSALAVMLVIALFMSPNAQSLSHDPIALAVAEHGHLHDDLGAIPHALHGHDVMDHDHTVAFLPPRETPKTTDTKDAPWRMAAVRLGQAAAFDLDRPPRG